MAQRLLFHIGGIIAAGAGVIGVPANLGAGRGLRGVVHDVMPQRLLHGIGRVVAAEAGIVGIPADDGAGRGSPGVVGELVLQRLLFNIGGVGTAGAGHVSVPALFGAGGFLCVMLHQIVGVGVNLAVVTLAHSAVGRVGAGRGGGLRVVCGCPIDRMPAASIGDLCRVLGLGGLCIAGRGRAYMGIGVRTAVAALAHSAVGRRLAGRGGGFRVVCGCSINRMPTAAVFDLLRVLGLGGLCIAGRGRACMGIGVRTAVAALAHSAVGRRLAGGGGGFGVGLGRSFDRMRAVAVGRRRRVLGLGGLCVGGRGRANVVVRV